MRISITSKLYALAAAAICLVVAVGAWWQRGDFPRLLGLISDDARHFLTTTLFHVGGQPVRILFLIKTFCFLVFLTAVSQVAQRSLRLLVRHHKSKLGPQREYLLLRSVSFAIYASGFLIGVEVENINLNTLVVLGGSLGLGVGFGLQPLVSNFVAGLTLLIEQPIRLGDRIEFGDKAGEVVRVGARSSWIRTYDNAILIVPNSEFVTKQVLNWTASDPKIRFAVPVSVAYGSDLKQVMRILLELAGLHEDVMEHPPPNVILSEMGPHAITFTLHVWTLSAAESFPRIRSDIYLQILRQFSEEKIEVPFPQLDLHLHQPML